MKIGNSQEVSAVYGRMRDGSPQPTITSREGPIGSGRVERIVGVMCGVRERI